jgi:uncharacterized membrane protein
MVDLGTPTGVGSSYAYGVNNAGQVVGVSECGATRWDATSGTIVVLGSLAAPNTCAPGSLAYGINNIGQVVGESSPTGVSTDPRHATLWY